MQAKKGRKVGKKSTRAGKESEEYHWADGIAEELAKKAPKSGKFVCAAGITPSGTVHIGNFREIITVEIVARALKEAGREVRFIYSWDDFDRLRKVPRNMPEQGILQNYIGMPITATPDTFGCHNSYAEHFEKEIEAITTELGIFPEFLYQARKYQNCEYAEEIKFVLYNKEKIKLILNRFKTEPITEEWWPVQIYCEKCKKDTTRILSWDKNFMLGYECKCKYEGKVDFSKKGIVKLPWRIDWPMRWHYEKVDFEPGGKEHSTPGGSRDTAKAIIEGIYKEQAPLYLKYDFITIKGQGGKMSKSLGNVITPKQCLEIYEPQILRYLFVKTRPNTEFAISFDNDVLKIYAEYDMLEEHYFSRNIDKKNKRIYELSQVEEGKKPKKVFAPNFRQIAELVQIKDTQGILEFYRQSIKTKEDGARTLKRAELARNWLNHAPAEFIFKIQEKPDKKVTQKLKKKEISALKELAKSLSRDIQENELINELKKICEKKKIKPKDFFRAAYLVLISKEQGPRLSNLIMLDKEKARKLLEGI